MRRPTATEGGTHAALADGSRGFHRPPWSLDFALWGDSDFRIFSSNNRAAPLCWEVICRVEITQVAREVLAQYGDPSVATLSETSPFRAARLQTGPGDSQVPGVGSGVPSLVHTEVTLPGGN